VTPAKLLICPYCGETQATSERCTACGGLFEPLSRQATHNAMGPWYIRDPQQPFRPGCSHDTLMTLIDRGVVTRHTIIRGPTTRQFWTIARRVPGVAHRLGVCHACGADVDPTDHGCHACGAAFSVYYDRNFLGVPDIRPMPWEAQDEAFFNGTAATDEPWTVPRGRLSSFATDEQLFRDAATSPGVTATVTDEAPRETVTVADATAQATINALRRTMQRQSRQLRRVIILVAVTSTLAISLLLVILLRPSAKTNDTAVAGTPAVEGHAPSSDVDAASPSLTSGNDGPEARASSTDADAGDTTETPVGDVDVNNGQSPAGVDRGVIDEQLVVAGSADLPLEERRSALRDAMMRIDDACETGELYDTECESFRERVRALRIAIEVDAFFDEPA